MATVDARISAYLAGDHAAGEELLLELLPRVRNVIRALIGRDVEVDDIAQLVMVAVIAGLSGFRGESPLKGWVDRIAVRVTLSHMRQRRGAERSQRSFDEDRPSASPRQRSDFEEAMLRQHDTLRLLDELPAAQKTAVLLHHGLGFSVAEVAEQEQVSQETVRSRLRLGLNKLRDWTQPPAVREQDQAAASHLHGSPTKRKLVMS